MSIVQKFFFDTAEHNKIIEYWERLKSYVSSKSVIGITTNPNALDKISCKTLRDFEITVYKLCKTVTNIRCDDQGIVYVQLPASTMNEKEMLHFAKYILEITDGKTATGLKIPPYKLALNLVGELNEYVDVNVTGIAECATALKCLSYNVRYVSMIPGRMEEKGIDAKRHIQYVNQRKETEAEIIAGSMRTLEGLQWVISNDTVPTIGTRVFDQIISSREKIKQFVNMWNISEENSNEGFSPLITESCIELSKQFFNQMDNCGKELYKEVSKKLCR